MVSVVQVDAATGRLVRRMVPLSRKSKATEEATLQKVDSQKIAELINEAARKHEVEAPLIRSVMGTESNYNPLAVSNKGAQGLMQLIPSTARRFGVKDSFDSRENVEGGVKYLRYLIDLFHGDYERAIAAYNAGEGAVAKYNGVPPYRETQDYVKKVAKRLAAERGAVVAAAEMSSPETPIEAPGAEVETYSAVVASVMPDGRVFYRTP